MGKILTVSVAAYNAEKWLSKCLDSFCIREIMDDLDVIIINDGSKDGTKEVAQSYVDRHPGTFRLIDKENGGHGSTINVGIKNAIGKYFKLVDADDWVEREGLIELVEKLKTLDVDAVGSPYFIVHADDGSKTKVDLIEKNPHSIADKILNVDVLPFDFEAKLPTLTFKSALLQKYFTPVDEHCFYVDAEYNVFYFSLVKTIYITEKPVYDYLMGTTTQSVNIANMVRFKDDHLRVTRNLVRYYENHHKVADEMPVQCRMVIEQTIIAMYRTLLCIPGTKESLAEVQAFDGELKDSSQQLYKSAVATCIKTRSETAMVVFLLRKFRFQGYGKIHSAIQKMIKGRS